MSEDRERLVRLQFLDEALEYIKTIESGLLEFIAGSLESKGLDEMLRAVHSIKGSAAMMSYPQLSHFAHRLEDFLKVIKTRKIGTVEEETEQLLLQSVDYLRQIVVIQRQEQPIDETWLDRQVNPVFNSLSERLGEPQAEDAIAMLSAEVGEEMSVLVFETEVEEYLLKLELIRSNTDHARLCQELLAAAELLNGLAEMLELPAFSSICRSIMTAIETAPEKIESIAESAIATWRRAQALVLIGQTQLLPTEIEFNPSQPSIEPEEIILEDLDSSSILVDDFNSLLDENILEQTNQTALSSFNDLIELETVAFSEDCSDNKPVVSINLSTIDSPESKETQDDVFDRTVRVSIQQLEQLGEQFGEINIGRNGINGQIKNLRSLVNLLNQRVKNLEQSNFRLRVAYDRFISQEIDSTQFVSNNSGNSQDDRTNDRSSYTKERCVDFANLELNSSFDREFDILEMDRYNHIHSISGEIMENVVQIQEVGKDLEISLEETERNLRELTRTTKQMQSSVTQVRMRPIADLVDRFPRALRDMQREYGKKVQLQLKGTSTLVDRNIIEALNDPLMHLFRNAFDHGIETPETRQAVGKPEEGLITIDAYYRGNQIVITVSDDGDGINLDKIRAKAIEIGFNAEDLAIASDRELVKLIFEPGFTTAEEVSNLSGRGVGMDVVHNNIEKVRGKIEVNTELGLGTTFVITVPFNLSVMRVLIGEIDGMQIAFPTNSIEEVLTLDSELVETHDHIEIFPWQERQVILIRLHQWLNIPRLTISEEIEQAPTLDQPTILVVDRGNDDLIGIVIDRYWREEEVTVRQVDGIIPLPQGFTGCTILGDGRILPLADALTLIDWVNHHMANPSEQNFDRNHWRSPLQLNQSDRQRKKTVMIVDDSINVRRFMALTLEKANYRVEEAKDGQDALEKLRSPIAVDAVICDIEMPRVDGYSFLSQIKSQPQYQNLPVIMLTSRSSEKHRRLAINLGATAYFTKPFKEQELLEILALLIEEQNLYS